ncbi:maleylpyruvate isomerase family mycothiol-dependent enzyme [Streptomyces sp. URMC 123]|uniref:maleylpyruvate isomerase family mycothiol-dependent enzyme n=1 Tax=Streptomyces sp. URMC 123 TaxID=3423403 RepID=UPI003F1CBC45
MTLLDHGRYCAEITAQTEQLRTAVTGADLTATVPTCPEWTLGELVRHVGGAHRWVTTIVTTRAAGPVPWDAVPGTPGPADDEPDALLAWLAEGAETCARTLREAGPDLGVWAWMDTATTGAWARRVTHETVVHRADAVLAVGGGFTVAPEVAADTIDEWLEILASPNLAVMEPKLTELRGTGQTIHLHATDAPGELRAEWLIELGESGFTWRRAHDKATVALRGSLADVLLAFYRRLPVTSDRVELLGEAELLDFWLERATFG